MLVEHSADPWRLKQSAVTGRHNQPLYIASYTGQSSKNDDLKWHFVAHTSLDMFEERGEGHSWLRRYATKMLKMNTAEASNVRQNDHYAGLLQVMDDYAV